MSDLVLEVARIRVLPGSEAAFEGAFTTARRLIAQSEGFRTLRIARCIETPTQFVLLVEWDSVQAHDDFRASARFRDWRSLLGPHFAELPIVEHFRDIGDK